jgi:hypothetical protein
MEQIILLAIQAIEALLPTLAGATSGQLQGVIVLMERVIPEAVQLGEDAIVSVTNIIAALQGNGAVTADQVATLRAQSAALDAALDAAAKDDGLTQ